MRRLHVSVLMRLTDIDAMATDAVVFEELSVLDRELFVAGEVVDRSRQAVAANATRNSPRQMQCIL
jgi:hypothetical protein